MKVILISDIKENEKQQKISGVRRYALTLHTFLKKKKEYPVQLYSTKRSYSFFSFLQTLFGKDINSLLTKMPLFFPFKKFPSDSVIHLTTQTFAIPLAWQKPKQPVIVTVHDIIPYVFHQYNSISERFLYKFVIKGLRNATYLITDSEHTKKDLMELLHIPEEKIAVIHLGVDVEVFFSENAKGKKNKQNMQRQENIILYVGSETKRKNLSTLFKAVAEIKKQLPNIQLVKIGVPEDKKEHEKLQSLAKKLQITENIMWKGYVENLVVEYRKATVFVLPSLYEGFGFPIIEAMACGCPVICSNKTSLPELGQDAALYFEGHDYHMLAQQLLQVLTDKKRQKQLREKGIKNVESFRWEKCVKMTEEVYHQYSQN